jgi:poly(hydroxyalkanoate) depolymerase family esterase
MVKTSNPWLRGLMRAGKRQQGHVARAVGSLLAAPRARPRAKPRPATVPITIAPPKPRRTVAATVPEPAAAASGKWLASHYSGGLESGALPLRRISYWLYLPDRPVPEEGLPLIVMLHGCDQSATLFAQGTRMNQLAEAAGYAVLYPQQSMRGHPRRCWKWYDRGTQQGGGDVPLIVGIVNKVVAEYPIDRSRIYICGISAGAGMANIVALNHPELFAGVGLHSGPSFGAGHSAIGALRVMRRGAGARVDGAIEELLGRRASFPPLPTILIQGEDDQVVRPINQAELERQAMLVNRLPAGPVRVARKVGSKRGNRNPYELRDMYRGGKLLLRVARVAQLQHAWSGGDDSLRFNSAAGPDASKMMLEFFAQHRRTTGPA